MRGIQKLEIALSFAIFSSGVFIGKTLATADGKKTVGQIYKEQADIRADLKSTVPADEFLQMEARIGKPAPKKELAQILGHKIYSPIKKTTDFKYFQDSIVHDREIWQKAFQYKPTLSEDLRYFAHDIKSLLKKII